MEGGGRVQTESAKTAEPARQAAVRPSGGDGLTSAFERALTGDRAAFGQVVLLTQDRLYTVLLRILGDRDDAREVAQDTYLKAMTSLHTFRGHASPYTWLYRIAVNLAVSRLRKLRRQRAWAASLPASLPWGSRPATETPPEAALRAERSRQVLVALGRLDSEYRAVLVLRDVDGLDYPEIAEVLQVPLGTVKSRLFRARLALRHELQRYAHPAGPTAPPAGPRAPIEPPTRPAAVPPSTLKGGPR
ncbi:MAG: RNA polymerase sigma factor [Tepidisphaerales bacterium]